MRNIVFAISLLAIFAGSLYENNYLITPNEIVWSDSVHLTWDNFGGLELPGKDHHLHIQLKKSQRISSLATIHSDIVSERLGKTYKVKSIFYAGRSFCKIYIPGRKPTDEMLRHELYHFHLTELQTRQVRRALAAIDHSFSDFDMELLLEKYRSKDDSATNAYDSITAHGTKKGNQKYIEETIDSLLVQSDSLKQ